MATHNGCDARRVMTVTPAAETRRPNRWVRGAAVIMCVALCGACAGGHHGASAKRAAPGSDAMVSRLCVLGDRLEYRHYPGLDHGGVVAGSLRTVTDWINGRLAEAVPVTSCTKKS